MKYTVTIYSDTDAENPSDWDVWRMCPFSNKYVGSVNPYDYVSSVDRYGDVIPVNGGIRRKLETGTAFIVSCYQHSGCCYSLKGYGMQCPWDTTQVAGILLAHSYRDLPKGFEARRKSAMRFLELYNSWANGNVYGFFVEDEKGELGASHCGYYTPEDLFEDLEDEVELGAELEFQGDAAWLADYYYQPAA